VPPNCPSGWTRAAVHPAVPGAAATGTQEIANLAEGFERLDRQRERLLKLDEEVTATRTMAAGQRWYAQRVLRVSAATLISATAELDNLARTARQSTEEYELIAAEKAEKERRNEDLDRDVASSGLTLARPNSMASRRGPHRGCAPRS